MATIQSPVRGYTGPSRYGPLVLECVDGKATYDGELPPQVRIYLESEGYGIDGSEPAEPGSTEPEEVDARTIMPVWNRGAT
jgi:hypothetical protein